MCSNQFNTSRSTLIIEDFTLAACVDRPSKHYLVTTRSRNVMQRSATEIQEPWRWNQRRRWNKYNVLYKAKTYPGTCLTSMMQPVSKQTSTFYHPHLHYCASPLLLAAFSFFFDNLSSRPTGGGLGGSSISHSNVSISNRIPDIVCLPLRI